VTELRIRRRVSQATLADKLGYSVSYISKLERGEMNPTLRTLFDIADALAAEPDAIIRTMKRRFEKAKGVR
jgi:transcriptional regulator with XRE-family HTH domain